MKRKLFIVLAIAMASLSPSALQAQDPKAIGAYESAIGATSAQGVLVSYFAVNSLGDAFAKKAYDAEAALQIAAVYENTTTSASAALKKLMGEVEFSDADGEYLNNVIKLYDTIAKQAAALKGVIEGDEDAAGVFETNRQKAQKMIDQIFGDSLNSGTGGGKEDAEGPGDDEDSPAPPAPPKKKRLLDE